MPLTYVDFTVCFLSDDIQYFYACMSIKEYTGFYFYILFLLQSKIKINIDFKII